MLFDDRSLSVQRQDLISSVSQSIGGNSFEIERGKGSGKIEGTYFKSTTESVKKNSKEEQSSTTEERCRSVLEIVEDTANNQSHARISDNRSERETHITFQS